LDGVAPSQMVGVSASVNLALHQKVQKFSYGAGSPGWSRKKGHKTVVVDILLISFRRMLVFISFLIVFYCNLCVCFIVLCLSVSVFFCYYFMVNKRFVLGGGPDHPMGLANFEGERGVPL